MECGLVEDDELGVIVIDKTFGDAQIALHRRLHRVDRLLVDSLDVDYREIRGFCVQASRRRLGDVDVSAGTKAFSVVEHTDDLETHAVDPDFAAQVFEPKPHI